MTVISGKDGYVDGVPCTTSWSVSHTAGIQRYAASCTQGGTGVVEGNESWTGNMAGLGPNPPVKPGDSFTFLGVIDDTTGSEVDLNGTVLIENVAISIPVAGGGPITWTASFSAQGLMTAGSVGGADATSKLAVTAADCGVTVVSTAISAIQNITLNFAAPSSKYVLSGASHGVRGNFSAGISFSVLDSNIFVSAYQPNVRAIVKVTMADATYWLLDEIVFGALSNFMVDVKTRSIVGYTVNGFWSATSDLTTSDLGEIISPDETVWFP